MSGTRNWNQTWSPSKSEMRKLVRRQLCKNWNLLLRKEDWDSLGMSCGSIMADLWNKSSHALGDEQYKVKAKKDLDWQSKVRSKRYCNVSTVQTEKTGINVWPNVFLTQDEPMIKTDCRNVKVLTKAGTQKRFYVSTDSWVGSKWHRTHQTDECDPAQQLLLHLCRSPATCVELATIQLQPSLIKTKLPWFKQW